MLANIKRLHEAGALIAVGSDSGNIGTLHGPAFHRELHLLAEAGLSPMAILIAATSHGAQVLGRASELGLYSSSLRVSHIDYFYNDSHLGCPCESCWERGRLVRVEGRPR